jgi:hypothetical protein
MEISAETTFTLKPFAPTAETTDLAVTATVTRKQDLLSISYCLKGDLAKVALPAEILAANVDAQGKGGAHAPGKSSADAQRKDRLWERTCFEFFLAEGFEHTRAAPYWEFNLSPTGDWNVFSLQRYRQGLKEESAFLTMPVTLRTSANALHLGVSVDTSALVGSNQPLRLGISAVLLLHSQQESFWAVAHPASEADFHHPDSFVIALNL